MQRIDQPTYKADDGSLHKTSVLAAQHDANEYFATLLQEYESGAARFVASKWVQIRDRLNRLYTDLQTANTHPVSTGRDGGPGESGLHGPDFLNIPGETDPRG